MADLPTSEQMIGPTVTEAQFKTALQILLENVASKDWANINPLFKPVAMPSAIDFKSFRNTGLYVFDSDAVFDASTNKPPIATSKKGYLVSYYISASVALQVWFGVDGSVATISSTAGTWGSWIQIATRTWVADQINTALTGANQYTDQEIDALTIAFDQVITNTLAAAATDATNKANTAQANAIASQTEGDAALAEQITELGISQTNDSNLSVAIVDSDNKRTWIEADNSGKPTTYAAGLIGEAVGVSETNDSNLSVAIVDSDNKRTWIEADNSGKPTTYAAGLIGEAVGVLEANFNKNIICWGDSMTAGAGGGGTTYPNVLQTLLSSAGSSAQVKNAGVGGENSVTICARQGGNPFIVTVDSGSIPSATTATQITLALIDGQAARPLLQGNGTAGYGFVGKLAGVQGTIALVQPNGASTTWDNANYYTFTRSEAGSAVTVNRPTAFYLDFANLHLGDIHIIWIGQNGVSTTRSITDAKAMIQRMSALNKRYLVISKPTSSDADDSAFFAEFGRRFVAGRKYMIEYGLADADITPTTQDTTDIANGVVPTSLRTDAVHWTAAGYTILANVIFKRLNELGWI